MSSDSDSDDASHQDMETGRVSRYFLYRHRERQAVQKAKLKTVLDGYRERGRRRDPVRDASRLLTESLGLTIVCADDKSKKFYVARSKPYPRDFPIPFSGPQKAEYGLLTLIFFILHFKAAEEIDADQLRQNVEARTCVDCDALPFGKWPDLIAKWASQDYIRLEKRDAIDQNVARKVITLGGRFHAEFGEELLQKMAKELISDEAQPNEEEDAHEKAKEKAPEEEVIEVRPPRRAAGQASQARGQARQVRRPPGDSD
jgi:hypothetical protein